MVEFPFWIWAPHQILFYSFLICRGRRPRRPAATRCHPRTRRFLSGFFAANLRFATLENDGERKRRREGSRVVQMLLCDRLRVVEDVDPYNVRYNIFVGTGVPDCPFGRKCYFMTAREGEPLPYGKEISFISRGDHNVCFRKTALG